MYKYLRLDTENYQGLLESLSKDQIREIIIEQVPVDFDLHIQKIEEGIAEKDYDKIRRGVHDIKANFRHFIPKESELIMFIQDFENRAGEKQDEQENGTVEHHVDFTPDLNKLKEISKEPMEEIIQLGREYKNQ